MDKQINHDEHHDQSKTRTHRLSKLPNDGDPWSPNFIDVRVSAIYQQHHFTEYLHRHFFQKVSLFRCLLNTRNADSHFKPNYIIINISII